MKTDSGDTPALLSVPCRACDSDRKVTVIRYRRLGAISCARYQQIIGCLLLIADQSATLNDGSECHAKRSIIASLSLSGHPESMHRRSVHIDEGWTSLTVHCRPYLGLRYAVVSCYCHFLRGVLGAQINTLCS